MRSNFKSIKGSNSKYIINNFNILRCGEKVFSKKKDLFGEKDFSKKKFKSGLNSFLNFLTEYLVPLTFVFKNGNILYNNKPNLKKYFL